ncbi:hypothetical protein EDD11_001272 [Mortierella claussenii]|nr:hypothetical protein EDD11_001272 [Mortierella claussenii]
MNVNDIMDGQQQFEDQVDDIFQLDQYARMTNILHAPSAGQADNHLLGVQDEELASISISEASDSTPDSLDARTFAKLLSQCTINPEGSHTRDVKILRDTWARSHVSILQSSPSDADHWRDGFGQAPYTTSTMARHSLELNSLPPLDASVVTALTRSKTVVPNAMSSLYFPPTTSALHQKRRKAKKHAIRVPRPKNCFMLYRSKVLHMIMVELGMINNKIISKIAAERWRAESEPVKAWYRLMAKRGKEEHARNNPGYKYAPLKRLLLGDEAASTDKVVDLCPEDSEDDEYEGHLVVDADTEQTNHVHHLSELDGRRRSLGQCSDASLSERHSSSKRLKLGITKQVERRASSTSDGCLGEKYSSCPGGTSRRDRVSTRKKFRSRSDSVMQAPSLPEHGSLSTALPLLDFSMIDQQLYQAAQQNEYHRPQQQQEQQQVQQVLVPSEGQAAFYALDIDQRASSVTLIDPINNWKTHRYTDPSIAQGCLGSANGDKNGDHGSIKQMAFLANVEKELPRLPIDTTQLWNHPEPILSQLYTEYNKDRVSSWNPSALQGFESQLLATKEPSLPSTAVAFSMAPYDSFDSWQHHQNFQQQQQQQQDHQYYHPQQQQQHPYLIRPACPTGFMSFSDIRQGTLSMMETFSWLSNTSN